MDNHRLNPAKPLRHPESAPVALLMQLSYASVALLTNLGPRLVALRNPATTENASYITVALPRHHGHALGPLPGPLALAPVPVRIHCTVKLTSGFSASNAGAWHSSRVIASNYGTKSQSECLIRGRLNAGVCVVNVA